VKTDALFYRLFKEWPEVFFELIGRPASDSGLYRFDAVELKDTAARIDGFYGLLQPDNKEPVYFVEFQNYKLDRTYSNLFHKIGLYLEKVNPYQNWHAVVMYPSRSFEQENLYPYRWLLASDQLTRIYLDELPEPLPDRFGLNVLGIIAATPPNALNKAQQLIPRVRSSDLPVDIREKLIRLIETVVLYQFPNKSRKELEAMLQVDDVRETKVFQEALEEGLEKGLEKGKRLGVAEAKEAFARRLLARDFRLQEIAQLTGLTLSQVKKLKKQEK
jgi:predicted transposase/invertase (TIGR01784 family)